MVPLQRTPCLHFLGYGRGTHAPARTNFADFMRATPSSHRAGPGLPRSSPQLQLQVGHRFPACLAANPQPKSDADRQAADRATHSRMSVSSSGSSSANTLKPSPVIIPRTHGRVRDGISAAPLLDFSWHQLLPPPAYLRIPPARRRRHRVQCFRRPEGLLSDFAWEVCRQLPRSRLPLISRNKARPSNPRKLLLLSRLPRQSPASLINAASSSCAATASSASAPCSTAPMSRAYHHWPACTISSGPTLHTAFSAGLRPMSHAKAAIRIRPLVAPLPPPSASCNSLDGEGQNTIKFPNTPQYSR